MAVYYSPLDPARWQLAQQQRRDNQVRALLNMFMNMQQMKQQQQEFQTQQGWKEKVMTPYYQASTRKMLQPPPPPEMIRNLQYLSQITGITDWNKLYEIYQARNQAPPRPPEEIEAEAYARTIGGQKAKREVPTPTKPSAYEIKKKDLDRALKGGEITKEEYNQALFNLKKEVTPDETRRKGATIRDANRRELRDFYKGAISDHIKNGRIDARFLKNIVKEQGGGRPISSQGYFLDMPEKYNLALLNQRDGVATSEDIDTINKYNAMFRYFQDYAVKNYPSFKDWLKSIERKKKGLDKMQIKNWYEIYNIK